MTKRRNRDLNAKVTNPKASGEKPLSFQKPVSSKAIRYEPHTADKGETVFEDTRGITYGVEESGALRAINKPRSRVKRLRQEGAARAKARKGKVDVDKQSDGQ
jgi:hypothetical protein